MRCSTSRYQVDKYLVSRGCPVDEDACIEAAGLGDVQILAYLKRTGYPVGDRCLAMARKRNRREVVAWLKEQ